MTELHIGVSLMEILSNMSKLNYKETFKENDVINGYVFVRFDGRYMRDTAAIFKCKHCSREFRSPIHPIVKDSRKSCGCLVRKSPNFIHGHTRPGKIIPEFRIWSTMKERCHNPNNKSYKDYGGRGVSVCEKWRNDFSAFLSDVGRRPSKEYTLDRWPNNDGNYEPGNFRWATRIEQANNKRTTVLVTYKGQTKPLSTWCRELGLSYSLMRDRINSKKWTADKSFETPLMKNGYSYATYLNNKSKFISHSFGYIR